MRRFHLAILTTIALFSLASAARGQNIVLNDPPKILKAKEPTTKRAIDQRDSLRQYVEGLAFLREEKYHEALKAFEEAARLDPEAPAVVKAQLPILIALDRLTDALNAGKKVVALDPSDFGTWYVLAKLNKTRARYPESIAALEQGLKSAALKEHPEAAQQMLFELGSLFEQAERFAPAADAYNKAAAILEHPDVIAAKVHVPIEAVRARAADVYEKIGELYRKAKQYDPALAALTKAQERAPDRAGRLSYTLAQVSVEAGQPKNALKQLDVYLRTQPLGIEPYEMKIDLLRRVEQPEAIVPWLEQIAGRDRFNNALQLLYAKELALAKDTKKAEATYKKITDDSPSADAYRGLFHLYKNEGPAGMVKTLALLDNVIGIAAKDSAPAAYGVVQQAKAMIDAVRADGELARSLVETAYRHPANKEPLKFDTVYFLAVLADKHRKNEEAERFYRQCLKEKKAESAESVLYGGLLRVLLKARKHEAAIKVCVAGLKNAKTTTPLLFLSEMARAEAALHRYDDALRTTDKALAEPGTSELMLRMLRVRILTMAERFDAAETACKVMLKLYEKSAEEVEIRYLMSNVYSTAKRQADAEAQLQLILKIDPDNPTVNNDLAYLWADQNKNLAVAEDMIRKALDIDRSQRRRNPSLTAADDKDNAAYVDSLGWVLFRRGQTEEAKKELERAVVLDGGEDPVIYEHLGDVYRRLRMHMEASQAWQRSLELYKDGIRGKDEDRMRNIQRKLSKVTEEIGGR